LANIQLTMFFLLKESAILLLTLKMTLPKNREGMT
jgi:hypothetical protein